GQRGTRAGHQHQEGHGQRRPARGAGEPATRPGADPAAGLRHRRRLRLGAPSGQAELPQVTPAQFLIDTSALARMTRSGGESFGWDQAVAAGLVAVCPVTELEFFYSASSTADRASGIADLRTAFNWVPVHDRAF